MLTVLFFVSFFFLTIFLYHVIHSRQPASKIADGDNVQQKMIFVNHLMAEYALFEVQWLVSITLANQNTKHLHALAQGARVAGEPLLIRRNMQTLKNSGPYFLNCNAPPSPILFI